MSRGSRSSTSTSATSCGTSSCSRSSRRTSVHQRNGRSRPDGRRGASFRVSVWLLATNVARVPGCRSALPTNGDSLWRSSLARWLAAVAPARARGTVTVALVSDARVRALNREYRRKDHATDVLSFPSGIEPIRMPDALTRRFARCSILAISSSRGVSRAARREPPDTRSDRVARSRAARPAAPARLRSRARCGRDGAHRAAAPSQGRLA